MKVWNLTLYFVSYDIIAIFIFLVFSTFHEKNNSSGAESNIH